MRIQRLILSLLIAFSLSFLAITLTPFAQVSTPIVCPSAPAPRLAVGTFAIITPGTPNNVRSQPSTKSDVVTQVSPAESVLVIGAPTCAENYLWWQVQTQNGFSGWLAEGTKGRYFVKPSGSTPKLFTVDATTHSVAVTYDAISFTYNGALGDTVTAQTIYDVKASDADPFTDYPQHVQFVFGTITANNQYNYPMLSVYKLKDIRTRSTENQKHVDAIQKLLTTQPDLTTFSQTALYPPENAGLVFHAQNRSVPFQSGSAIRFIAHFAQDVSPITGDQLSYRFIGLSTDGIYYLVAQIPITTAMLDGNDKLMPDLSAANADTLYSTYVAQTTHKLDVAASADFAPNLDDLDTLFKSISIKASSTP